MIHKPKMYVYEYMYVHTKNTHVCVCALVCLCGPPLQQKERYESQDSTFKQTCIVNCKFMWIIQYAYPHIHISIHTSICLFMSICVGGCLFFSLSCIYLCIYLFSSMFYVKVHTYLHVERERDICTRHDIKHFLRYVLLRTYVGVFNVVLSRKRSWN